MTDYFDSEEFKALERGLRDSIVGYTNRLHDGETLTADESLEYTDAAITYITSQLAAGGLEMEKAMSIGDTLFDKIEEEGGADMRVALSDGQVVVIEFRFSEVHVSVDFVEGVLRTEAVEA